MCIRDRIKDIDTNMIVNVSGHSPESYAECAARINELDKIPAIELNISCPNVKDGGMAFGVTCEGCLLYTSNIIVFLFSVFSFQLPTINF